MWIASTLTMVVILHKTTEGTDEEANHTDVDMLERLGLPYVFAGM